MDILLVGISTLRWGFEANLYTHAKKFKLASPIIKLSLSPFLFVSFLVAKG